jgi:Domain of Unknown Function (DUF1080)
MAYRNSTLLLLTAAVWLNVTAQGQTGEWKSLFDGKSLQAWREAPFKGHAAIRVDNETLVLEAGSPMTGATWTGDFPKSDYEVRFEAARQKGNDFFASLTFPAGDSFCTWVTGGWGGDIVGLSSIDDWNAADNETRTYFTFETGKWYRFRLLVASDRIQAWIDDKPVINVEIAGRKIGLRFEDMKLSAPLGFASYLTKGAVRNIEYRVLKP